MLDGKGRARITDFGFYISPGNQPVFGSVLKED
jgi:hypothetical protein